MTLLMGISLAVFSSWMIHRACDGFEEAADFLGRNLTEGTKGATINAIGSSMPELWVTVIYLFFFRHTTGFAGGIGTTAGSAVFNAMVIPSLVILTVLKQNPHASITVSKLVVLRDGLTLLAADVLLIFFIGQPLSWHHGMFLMLIYIFYALWIIYRCKTGPVIKESKVKAKVKKRKNGRFGRHSRLIAFLKIDLKHAMVGESEWNHGNSAALLAVSTLFIAFACGILVYSCETIGMALGIHGYFVSVIIAAGASSVPDTILSVKDAGKGNYDDAVANALGSNIFDICVALGAPLFLFTSIHGPITMDAVTAEHVSELLILLLGMTFVTFVLFLGFKRMTRHLVYTLMAMYILFVAFVAGKAYKVPLAMEFAEGLHTLRKAIF